MIDELLNDLDGFDTDTSNIIEQDADFLPSMVPASSYDQMPSPVDIFEDTINSVEESVFTDIPYSSPDALHTIDYVQTDDIALNNMGETTGSVGLAPLHKSGLALNETTGFVDLTYPREDESHVVFKETTGSVGFAYPNEEGNAIAFGRKEDMLPYDEKLNLDLERPMSNPFGIYANRFPDGQINTEDCIPKPAIPIDFTEVQLQDACNKICDVLHIRHMPVFVTTEVPNAEHTTMTGPFRFTLFDDKLSLNPDYAKKSIEIVGTTDIVLSDMGHEIGHAMASKYCGNLSTYMNEKIADFISGFVNSKIGVDIDAPRQWFMSEYDPIGRGGYPISEERWDIEAAGYYFGKLVGAEELKKALKDPEFLKIIRDYNSDTVDTLAQEELNKLHSDSNSTSDLLKSLLFSIEKYLSIKTL